MERNGGVLRCNEQPLPLLATHVAPLADDVIHPANPVRCGMGDGGTPRFITERDRE